MARVTDPSFQFWFSENFYTVQGAETMFHTGTKDDISTMRSEYTRMRDVAQKRIARLQKVFPDTKGAKIVYDTGKVDKEGNPIYKSGFPTLKTIDPRDFPKAFAELAKFVKAKGSTVTGQRQIKEKTIKTWQDQGLDLNKKNYDRVIKVMEELRKRKVVYGSDKAIEVVEETMGLDEGAFNAWLDHIDFLMEHSSELKRIDNLQGYNFDEIQRMLGE